MAITVVMDTPLYWGGDSHTPLSTPHGYKKTPTGPYGTYQPGLYAGDQAQKSETISLSSDFFRKRKKQVAEKYAI